MRTADFDFPLPPQLIAQHPAERRDGARLMVISRTTGTVEHRQFPDLLGFLRPGDLLILNNSKVIPARLRGVNARSGGAFEMLLLEETALNDWWAMIKPGKRAPLGTQIVLTRPPNPVTAKTVAATAVPSKIIATVTAVNDQGHRRLSFEGTPNIVDELNTFGELPLPPYIRRDAGKDTTTTGPTASDLTRYQTVFAQPPGSVAAPTAGLHFTSELLAAIRERGVEPHFVTLHVGLGTFAPVKSDTLEGHVMHEERYEVSDTTARAVNAAKAEGRRVIAIGTTSVRVLESAAEEISPPNAAAPRFALRAGSGRTRIFIHPPHRFKLVDALLTNFHLPCSTLLMLVSAFAAPGELRGRELILKAYADAIRERYRFFSYGDAMFIS